MARTNDPLLEAFRHRDDPAVREKIMRQLESGQVSRKDRKAAKATTKRPEKPGALIALDTPDSVTPGQKATVKLKHHFPADLGEKPVQVTLKGGDNSRIERKEVKASGTGVIEVTFDIPAGVKSVIFAALVGTSIKDTPQHLQTKPIPVR